MLTRTLEKSIKSVCLSSFNKNLNRSTPFNILDLMNVREFFLAHLVKFNCLQDVFNSVAAPALKNPREMGGGGDFDAFFQSKGKPN